MIHYSCDRCHNEIDTAVDLRYQVNIVTQVMLDGPDVPCDVEDRDHLTDVDELLQRVDDEQCEELCEDLYQTRRFDLCANCYRQYLQNPLGCEPQLQVEFSEN